MSKKSREAIRGNLARAIAPPTPTRKRSAHLDGLLDEYAPPEAKASDATVLAGEMPAPDVAPAESAPPAETVAGAKNARQPLRNEPAAESAPPVKSEGAKTLSWDAPHLRIPHEITDRLLPSLRPGSQVVLLRLYRLSAGFNSDTCHVSIPRLATACNVSETQLRVFLRDLEARKLIRRVSVDLSNKVQAERGITFQVLLPRIAPAKSVPATKIAGGAKSVAPAESEPNKVKAFKINTHKEAEPPPAAGVGALSRFSLKECIAYAEHRRASDPNMRSAEAVGRKLYETGREDELIAEWLAVKDTPKLDISQCSDCHGTGMYYPEGVGKGGVKKCDHKGLKAALSLPS